MKQIQKILKKADFFGIPFLQQINQKESIYQSAIGGFVTLLVFCSSLAYTIWVIYQWQTNQLSPKISNSVHISNFSLLDFNYDVVKLYFWKVDETFIDPFEEKVLLPILSYTTTNGTQITEVIQYSDRVTNEGNKFFIPKINFGTEYIDGNAFTTSQMYIQIIKCRPELLQFNETCASEETSNRFFEQPLNAIAIQITFKQINSKNGEIQSSAQEFYFQIEQPNCYTLNVFLQSNFYDIRDYFLFGPSKYKEFLNSAVIQSQTNTINYCQKAYQEEVYGLLFIAMQASQVKTIYEYPHAGDLLANIGSIVSVLFMMKYLIIVLNQYFLTKTVINEIMKMYYPQLKFIKLQKNWRRKIVGVYYNKLELDVKEYLKFYKLAQQQMKPKLSFLNLLYEVSRIYFILRSIKTRDEFRKCLSIGVKLNFLTPKESQPDSGLKSYFTQRFDNDNQLLTYEDVSIISLFEQNQVFVIEKIINDLETQNLEFYEINKVL